MDNTTIIAFGNKARQGKDYSAEIITQYVMDEMDMETVTMHWADKLYEEVRNENTNYPLIKSQVVNGKRKYYLLDKYNNDPNLGYADYKAFSEEEVPYLHKIFTTRNIKTYKKMIGKDAEILQFWGTDFRRNQDPDYWVKLTLKEIDKVREKSDPLEPLLILIPDTRYINEYNAVTDRHGFYVKVSRYNADGSRFIASYRDPSHISETQLDDVVAKYAIAAKDGNLDGLKNSAIRVFGEILEDLHTCNLEYEYIDMQEAA